MNNRYLLYALIPIMEKGHNFQEARILQLVFEKKRSILEISRELGIDYKNTHRYVYKLHKDKLIIFEPPKPIQGKKVFIALSERILRELSEELEAILLRNDYRREIEALIRDSRRKLRYIQLIGSKSK